MTTKKQLRIIAAANERNRRRDAEHAQQQKLSKVKEEQKCRSKTR